MERYYYQNKQNSNIILLQQSGNKHERLLIIFNIKEKQVEKHEGISIKQIKEYIKRCQQENQRDKDNKLTDEKKYSLLKAENANRLIKIAGLTPHCPAIQSSLHFQSKLGV